MSASRQSPPGQNGAGSAQSSPGDTKTKKSGSHGALSDFSKRFKNIRSKSRGSQQDGTPTTTSSFKGLRGLRASRDSESSIASMRAGSLKDVHHSDEDEDEDDEDDKILQFEQAKDNLQFKVEEAEEKLDNLEKKLDDGVYDERKYNKKKAKYEQQIESANAKIKEIEDNIENYREQKRKGGDGGMLNNLPFGTGTIMQGLLNKMGKRGGSEGSSKILNGFKDSSVGSDDERFESPIPTASPKQKRHGFSTPSVSNCSTGSATELSIPAFANGRQNSNRSNKSQLSTGSGGDVGISGERSPLDDIGGDRRERTRTVTLRSESDTVERMPSSETTPTGQPMQGTVEPGSSVGGMPNSSVAERHRGRTTGLGACASSISDPDFILQKNESLLRLKNIMNSDGPGRDDAGTPQEVLTPQATQSAKKSSREKFSFPTLRSHKKDKAGREISLNPAPVNTFATNEAFYNEISGRLAKLMDDTMDLTKLANDQAIARDADMAEVRSYREELAKQGKVLADGHALITEFDAHVGVKIKDEAAGLTNRIKKLESQMVLEKEQVEMEINKCQELEERILSNDEKMLEQIGEAQQIHQAYESRRTGFEIATHWYNHRFTTMTHKAVFWLAMLTFIPLIVKIIFKVGQEVEVVVETVVETVCHADNCTSICEGQIQEAIEELQSP